MKRIQRTRTKDYSQPMGTIYVGRPSKWGNPYKVGERIQSVIGRISAISAGVRRKDYDNNIIINKETACILYEQYLKSMLDHGYLNIEELKGANLSCWCSLDDYCHADILLKYAKRQLPQQEKPSYITTQDLRYIDQDREERIKTK